MAARTGGTRSTRRCRSSGDRRGARRPPSSSRKAARMPCARWIFAAHRAAVNPVLRRVSEAARAPEGGANLRGADLLGADLRGASLADGRLTGADTRAADVAAPTCSQTLFLSQAQIDAMNGDGATQLPPGARRPAALEALDGDGHAARGRHGESSDHGRRRRRARRRVCGCHRPDSAARAMARAA